MLLENLNKHRNFLHEIPEIAYEEKKTAEYIRKVLKEEGIEYFEVGTSTVGYINCGANETVGIRADIDALPLQEESNNLHKSKVDGMMHACGHDGHVSILLALIQEVNKDIKNGMKIEKNLVFVFQAAEEGGGGALYIAEHEKYKKLGVTEIYALHVMPEINVGEISIVEGGLTLQNINLDITITGKGCHGAQPHKGVDSILVGAKLVEAYQSIVSRNLPPHEIGILTIGAFKAGTVRNIIPEKVDILGTIRVANTELIPLIQERIEKINKGFEISYDVKIQMEFKPFYPPVINGKDGCEKGRRAAEKVKIKLAHELKLSGSEDFSFLLKNSKGAMFLLGVKDEKKGFVYPLHNPKFDFGNSALTYGVNFFKELLNQCGVFGK